MQLAECIGYQPKWIIRKYADDDAYANDRPFDVSEIDGNLLLNEGITRLLNLLIAGGGTAFDNANARIGIGDDATAEDAAQTDLLAAANKLYKGMEATYPSIAGQTVTFRAVFIGTEANYAWNEFTVDNGAAAGENLNRKVSAQGTKAAGQTWTVDLNIQLS